jgi:hypothetical protein
MSYPLRPLFPKTPGYLNIQPTGYIPLGGTFTGGTVSWINLTHPNQPAECIIFMVSVRNATWTGSAYSDKTIFTGAGRKLFARILPNDGLTAVTVKDYWHSNGAFNFCRVESNSVGDGTPYSADIIIWFDADTANAEFTLSGKYESVHEFMKLNKVISINPDKEDLKKEEDNKNNTNILPVLKSL